MAIAPRGIQRPMSTATADCRSRLDTANGTGAQGDRDGHADGERGGEVAGWLCLRSHWPAVRMTEFDRMSRAVEVMGGKPCMGVPG